MPRLTTTYTPPDPAQIKDRRAALTLTQAELADALGVAARTVQKWESGETRISKLAWLAIQSLQLRQK